MTLSKYQKIVYGTLGMAAGVCIMVVVFTLAYLGWKWLVGTF